MFFEILLVHFNSKKKKKEKKTILWMISNNLKYCGPQRLLRHMTIFQTDHEPHWTGWLISNLKNEHGLEHLIGINEQREVTELELT